MPYQNDGTMPYIDPDYIAGNVDDQLPLVSTMGRGPKGEGIGSTVITEDTDDSFSFKLVSDTTGETLLQSPNLHGGRISVGQQDPGGMTIFVTRGGSVTSYPVLLPAGKDGNRIYLLGGVMTRRADETYTCVEADLTVYGGRWSDCPSVRPGDIVVFSLKDSASRYLAFGSVQKASPAQVVFTSRTRFEWKLPYIGGNGNWFVEDQDTGVEAQGPKGDKAQMRIGTVTTLDPGKEAEASIALVDEEDNIYELSLKIPEGNLSYSLDIKPGVYTEATLPAFHLTPINTAYIVDDGGRRFDLYIRGREAAGDDQWAILENWEGKPATIGDVTVVHLKQNEEAYAEVNWSTTPETNRYDIKLFLPLDLVPGSITTEFIADGSVHTEHLAGGVITTEKIADKGVTLSKLGNDVLARIDINEIARQLAPMMSIKPDGTFVINTTD